MEKTVMQAGMVTGEASGPRSQAEPAQQAQTRTQMKISRQKNAGSARSMHK